MLALNLLPDQAKEYIRNKKNKRFVTVVGFSVFSILILYGALLFATKIYIDIQLAPLQDEVTREREREEAHQAVELEKEIQLLRSRITQLKDIQESAVKWHSVFVEFSTLPLEGITLKSITVSKDESSSSVGEGVKGLRKVLLAGHAVTRDESLLRFEDAIRENPLFVNLISPSVNHIKARDIDFTLTFFISEEN